MWYFPDMPYRPGDIASRIKQLLPRGWFGDTTPTLDSILNAFGAGWVSYFSLFDFVKSQARVQSSIGTWLDLIALDFSGRRLRRRPSESDILFRSRIIEFLRKERCCRGAVERSLRLLTGTDPVIFEPRRPLDTGCYGASGSRDYGVLGYGINGGWGNHDMPFQAFITVRRPMDPNAANTPGWNDTNFGYSTASTDYAKGNTALSGVTDTDIIEELLFTAPAASILWLRII